MPIRFVAPGDTPSILSIYAPFISDSSVSFELEVPGVTEMSQRIAAIARKYPWLVWEENGDILGYAYASAHRDRKAYQWSCETSVYLGPGSTRKGIGTQLYTRLFELLQQQGMRNAYAGITLPNPASEHFHASFGFRKLCVYKGIGYKFGKWSDVLWMEKQLPQPEEVAEPTWMYELYPDSR